MSGAAPWSVKGIEPKAREIAKDLARRSGMTLGEWLNQIILEGDEDDGYIPMPQRQHASQTINRRSRVRRLDDAYPQSNARVFDRGDDSEIGQLMAAIEAVSARIEAAERRSTTAIAGIDQAVTGLTRRIEATERGQAATDTRVEEFGADLREAARRQRRFEEETGPRQVEALRGLEGAIGKLAGQFYDAQSRGHADLEGLRARLDRAERDGGPDLSGRIAARLDEAQARTDLALKALEGSFAQLDARLRTAEQSPRGVAPEALQLEKLAETLTRRVEESRGEMMRRLDTAAAEGRADKLERALTEVSSRVDESERRSAQAIEAMGREVLRVAENLNGRVGTLSQDIDARITGRIDAEVARVADAADQRLRRAEDQHTLALEKLGGEITRISERLSERIGQGERRTAQITDALAERLDRNADKTDQRYDRATGELTERLRQSEERTARLLAEARESIDRQLGDRATAVVPATAPWTGANLEGDALFAGEAADADWRDPGLEPFPASPFAAAPVADPAVVVPTFDSPAAIEPQADAAPTYIPLEDETLDDELDRPFGLEAPAPVTPAFAAPDAFDAPFLDPSLPEAAARDPRVSAGPSASDPTDGFGDAFAAETEFVDERTLRAERPQGSTLSTRDAIAAARAATLAGEQAAVPKRKGFSFGSQKPVGKSKLQERLDKQARGGGSTVKTAFLASVTAVAITGAGVGAWQASQGRPVFGVDLGGPVTASPVSGSAGDATPLAATAVALPEGTDAATPSPIEAQAARLYDDAQAKLDAGDVAGVELLTRAAGLGYAPAQFHLARLYDAGQMGVAQNKVEARRWTERAAGGGDPRAMYNLGLYLFDGVGGAKDPAGAARWFRQAADKGFTDSQFNLGRLYELGVQGVAADPVEAYKWYLIAADGGDAGAEDGAKRLEGRLSAAQKRTARAQATAFVAAE